MYKEEEPFSFPKYIADNHPYPEEFVSSLRAMTYWAVSCYCWASNKVYAPSEEVRKKLEDTWRVYRATMSHQQAYNTLADEIEKHLASRKIAAVQGTEPVLTTDNGTIFYFIANEKEQESMNIKPITFTTITFVSGCGLDNVSIDKLTDDQAFTLIEQSEAELRRLRALVAQPKALADRIKATEYGITRLVSELDARAR